MTKFVAAAFAGVALMAIPGGAQAAVTVTGSFTTTSVTAAYSNAPTGDLHKTSTPTLNTDNTKLVPQILKGTFAGSSTQVSLFAYCVDIFQPSGSTTFTVKSLIDYLGGNTAKYNLITSLIVAEAGPTSIMTGAANPANKLHDAAMQMAIWEFMNETQSSYNINKVTYSTRADRNYQFYIDDVKNTGIPDGSNVLRNTANSFINAAVANAGKTTLEGYNFYVAKSQSKQDFLFWTYTPPPMPAIPEPATWAMMMLGFGMIGHSMRRRRAMTTEVSFG